MTNFKQPEQIRNQQAILLKTIDFLTKEGDEVTVISYHHDFGGYMIKDKNDCTHYVYRDAFKLITP